MKSRDFFSQLVRQGNISDAEATKFIETFPDAEIPDAFVKAHDNSFMTLDRAAAHKDIHGRIKREVLDPVDNDMNEFYEAIKEYADPNLENIIKSESNTYNKLKALKKILPEVIKKAKGSPNTDEDTKKKLTEYEKMVQELADKFTVAEKDYKKQLTEHEKQSEAKFNDYKLSSELEKLTNKYTLAEAFEKTRPAINKVTLAELRGSTHLKLGEKDGQSVILVLDDEGKPKFNGNSQVTIESLLEKAYEPFLKKSEGTPQETRRTTTAAVTPPNPNIKRGVSTTVK
jgi:hypothetical protein